MPSNIIHRILGLFEFVLRIIADNSYLIFILIFLLCVINSSFEYNKHKLYVEKVSCEKFMKLN